MQFSRAGRFVKQAQWYVESDEAQAELFAAETAKQDHEEHEDPHNLRWGDGNGYSHVRAALMGPSLTVPVVDGRLVHGTWQQIILCDFDNRPRRRRVVVQVMGL